MYRFTRRVIGASRRRSEETALCSRERADASGRACHVYALAYDSTKLAAGMHQGLVDELGRTSARCRVLMSLWLVASPEPAEALYRRVIRYFDGEDSVVVFRVTGEYCAWLPARASARDWLRRHV